MLWGMVEMVLMGVGAEKWVPGVGVMGVGEDEAGEW